MDDSAPKESCGVFGLFAPDSPVSHMVYLGLFALQHRGQESAGIAVSDHERIWVDKDNGLVSAIFDDRRLQTLRGDLAIGHTRYSTTGSGDWENSQPLYRDAGPHQFALAHNGNLVNTAELADLLGLPASAAGSDSGLVAELLARELPDYATGAQSELVDAFARTLPQLSGAYSLVLLSRDFLIGARDPHGFRPLILGRLDNGWVLASETPALDVVGAQMVREIQPGEVVVIDRTGVTSSIVFPAEAIESKFCSFEYVYFARPDGRLRGRNVHRVRQRMGEALAEQAPVVADAVVPIPESSTPGAQGYAHRSGIPYVDGFVKNRYIGRTFIAPTQEMRSNAVRIKLNPIRENIEGKRLVVVEDSIIRATTLRETMRMMRGAGVAEIHLRVLSPPYRWPCFYGMDTTDTSALIAAHKSVEDIREYLGADSLAYLELDAMLDAISPEDTAGLCTACLTGDYPVPVPFVRAGDTTALPWPAPRSLA